MSIKFSFFSSFFFFLKISFLNLFLNLLLEAALVLIKFNTRWHNSIKPPRTTTSVAAETSERQHLFSSYQVNIEPPRTMTLNHHEPLRTTTNHDITNHDIKPPRTTTNHHEP